MQGRIVVAGVVGSIWFAAVCFSFLQIRSIVL